LHCFRPIDGHNDSLLLLPQASVSRLDSHRPLKFLGCGCNGAESKETHIAIHHCLAVACTQRHTVVGQAKRSSRTDQMFEDSHTTGLRGRSNMPSHRRRDSGSLVVFRWFPFHRQQEPTRARSHRIKSKIEQETQSARLSLDPAKQSPFYD